MRSKKIIAAGLAGILSLGTASCGSNRDGGAETALGVLFGALGAQRGNAGAMMMGGAMQNYGESKRRENFEREMYGGQEGRENRIIYADPSLDRSAYFGNQSYSGSIDQNFIRMGGILRGHFYYFAANYWRDFDRDGKMSPREFVGIKDKFEEDEKIILVSLDNRVGIQGLKKSFRIYSPNNELIAATEEVITEEEYGTRSSIDIREVSRVKGYGKYKAFWLLEGKYDGSVEFEIAPSYLTEKMLLKDSPKDSGVKISR